MLCLEIVVQAKAWRLTLPLVAMGMVMDSAGWLLWGLNCSFFGSHAVQASCHHKPPPSTYTRDVSVILPGAMHHRRASMFTCTAPGRQQGDYGKVLVPPRTSCRK